MSAARLLVRFGVVTGLWACVPGGGVGTRTTTVASAPSGKKLAVYESSSFQTESRDVPEDVVVQAMRASSLFFEEDIRAFAKPITAQLPSLTANQRLVVETSDTAIHLYVGHGELQLVALRDGQEVSRHASAIPAPAVKTELAMKPTRITQPGPTPTTTTAQPTPEESARDLANAGTKHYELAEYAMAIESWKQAYVLASNPQLLFWIGEAYRNSGDCGQATRFYANYKQRVPSPSNRADLDAAVKACEKPAPVATTTTPTTTTQPTTTKPTTTKPTTTASKKPPPKKKLTEAEISAKLAELDRLLAQQLITQAEYDAKKKLLLDQM
jgi:hypothetical protein